MGKIRVQKKMPPPTRKMETPHNYYLNFHIKVGLQLEITDC